MFYGGNLPETSVVHFRGGLCHLNSTRPISCGPVTWAQSRDGERCVYQCPSIAILWYKACYILSRFWPALLIAEAQQLTPPTEESPVMMPPLPNWGTNPGGEAAFPCLNLVENVCQTCCQLLANERGFQLTEEFLIWITYAEVIKVQSFICRWSKSITSSGVHSQYLIVPDFQSVTIRCVSQIGVFALILGRVLLRRHPVYVMRREVYFSGGGVTWAALVRNDRNSGVVHLRFWPGSYRPL